MKKGYFALGFSRPLEIRTERELSLIAIEELLPGKIIRTEKALLEYMDPSDSKFRVCMEAIRSGKTVKAGTNIYRPETAFKLAQLLMAAMREAGDLEVFFSDF
jgi:hypothetical protein